jgi:hypothetical protein
MQCHERAAQIWPVLCLAAWNRQILSYQIVGQLIGVPHYALAQLLEPIQSYCLIRELPALTVIVVNTEGRPGTGFIAADNVSYEQQRVYAHDWLTETTPTPDVLQAAVLKLPSCGIPSAAPANKPV